MDIKDLTHEQMNQVAGRLLSNPVLISRARSDALSKLIRWSEEDGNWKAKSYLENCDPDNLEIVGDDPEVNINSEISSSGDIRIKADWVGAFKIAQRGVGTFNAFGYGSVDHEELMEMGEDLFYFEDMESQGEE